MRLVGQSLEKLPNRTSGQAGKKSFSESMHGLLLTITDAVKHDVQAQYLKRQHPFAKSLNKALDDSTVTSQSSRRSMTNG